MEWYVRIGARKLGLMAPEALRAMVETGQIAPDTLLWRPGLEDWVAASTVPGVLIPPDSPPPPVRTLGDSSAEHQTANRGSQALASTDNPGVVQPTAPNLGLHPLGPGATESTGQAHFGTPWTRFWARGVDLFVSSSLLFLIVGVVRPSIFEPDGAFGGESGGQLLWWVLFPVAMLADAIVYATFGNTFGKWVAGIKVLDLNGGQVPFRTYVRRNFGVWWSGLGTGFPLISMFTLASSHKRATRGDLMSWDESNRTRAVAVSTSTERTWAVAALYFLIVGGGATLTAMERNAAVVDHAKKGAEERQQAEQVRVDADLRDLAVAVNKGTPSMLDKSTRLDRAEAGPGLNFTYHYTMVDVRMADLEPASVTEWKESVERTLLGRVCEAEEFAEILRRAVTIHFHYVDQSAANVATFSYNNARCGR